MHSSKLKLTFTLCSQIETWEEKNRNEETRKEEKREEKIISEIVISSRKEMREREMISFQIIRNMGRIF